MFLRQIVEEDRRRSKRQQEVNLRLEQDGVDAAEHSVLRFSWGGTIGNFKGARLR